MEVERSSWRKRRQLRREKEGRPMEGVQNHREWEDAAMRTEEAVKRFLKEQEHRNIDQREYGYHIDDCVFCVELFMQSSGSGWKIKTGWQESLDGCRQEDGSFSREKMLQQKWQECHGLTFKTRHHDTNAEYDGGVQRLHRLELLDNNLTGTLPATFSACTSLVFVNIGHNHLNGLLPQDVGRLESLRYFSIYGNSFTAGVPASLGNCRFLEVLFIGANRLDGKLPQSFCQLKNLVTLSAGSNNLDLSEPLPEHILQCTRLQLIDLTAPMICRVGRNQNGAIIVGSGSVGQNVRRRIPADVDRLAHLETLACGNVRMRGPLPESLFSLIKLKTLKLSHNELEGRISPSIGKLRALQCLELDSNKFEGPVPSALCQLRHLTTLNLRYNRLQGTLPREMALMTQLRVLDIRSQATDDFRFPAGSIGDQKSIRTTWSADAVRILPLFASAVARESPSQHEIGGQHSNSKGSSSSSTGSKGEHRSEVLWLLDRVKHRAEAPSTSTSTSGSTTENKKAHPTAKLPSLEKSPPLSPPLVTRSWALREKYMMR